ncbi:long-chain-fatty-acid--CoA ligase [Halalkalibacter akibai]|uniref:Long-chain-fatty-acid-CoA ligase n=1 Tax=Halalkalibacter akibai (strain ATCC 43226 / DSM 21942 / CIP 109018 / JCM 9157 / 1139) TaxID=1236973 RepID=W4QQS1_HALA3|nr:long-chain-fatty-acid--CoA ligase [Halalkalibacter akibai]GAE33988.1 long-chain-fatty-acid-CoA ligase [Halalkalibacter akibai JCM 9157]
MKNYLNFYPNRVPRTITIPETTLFENLEMSARRYPNKTALHYYGRKVSYQELYEEVLNLAGYLQEKSVSKGERVLLYMQNSPQWIISFYAIARIGVVVIPANPMCTNEELTFFIQDGAVKTAIISQELLNKVDSSLLEQVIVAAYSDYIDQETDLALPPEVRAPRQEIPHEWVHWINAISFGYSPKEMKVRADDLVVMPYTSGTTGLPKGCMHTNKTVQANIVSVTVWQSVTSESVHLLTLPLFHVTGMLHSCHGPLAGGCEIVIMTRWDRELARQLIERNQVTHWTNISTMLIDFLANPNLTKESLNTVEVIGGGGAPLPAAVGEKLFELAGIRYSEGYGLSETISHTHLNPPDRPKMQCLGLPSPNTISKIIDPTTLKVLGPNEEGEIIVYGPQIFKGYYNRPEENVNAFIEVDGQPYFRTGDIAKYDEEGYYFIVDRIKRMINASGFKVWPTEVESMLYKHPAIQQACVVGIPDEKRGETVKAFIILNEKNKGKITEEEIIEWSKKQLSAYKYPRIIEFREQLPTTSSGKLLWRHLQDEEKRKVLEGS